MLSDIKSAPEIVNFSKNVPAGTKISFTSGLLKATCEDFPCEYLSKCCIKPWITTTKVMTMNFPVTETVMDAQARDFLKGIHSTVIAQVVMVVAIMNAKKPKPVNHLHSNVNIV